MLLMRKIDKKKYAVTTSLLNKAMDIRRKKEQ